MKHLMRSLAACAALALVGPSLLRAQSPSTRALIARAKSDSAAGYFAGALARLKPATAASPADRKALGLAAAQVHLDWADGLTPIRAMEALEHSRSALALYQSLDPRQAGNAFMEMGLDYGALGLDQQAVAAYQQALPLFRNTGNAESVAGPLYLLALPTVRWASPPRRMRPVSSFWRCSGREARAEEHGGGRPEQSGP